MFIELDSSLGSSAADPFLPVAGMPTDPGFTFSIPGSGIVPGASLWIDPDMAIGYSYEIFGAEVTGIELPDFATVPDEDGYMVKVGGASYGVPPGGILDFAGLGLTGITAFTILGIDPGLGLDPEDPLAFATGLFLSEYDPAGTVYVDQVPIIAPVPVPAALPLVVTGLGALAVAARRRRA